MYVYLKLMHDLSVRSEKGPLRNRLHIDYWYFLGPFGDDFLEGTLELESIRSHACGLGVSR